MTKINKIANFWMRFLAKAIDIILVATITVLLALPNLRLAETITFKAPWNFYLWVIIAMIIWPTYFVILPFIAKGMTLGLLICQLKLKIEKEPKIIALLKRELFFSLLIAFNFLLVLISINHTLANRFFQVNQENISYSAWENFRISLVTVFLSLSIFVQMLVGITIIVKKSHGLNDTYSHTQIVYRHKMVELKKTSTKSISKKYKPKLIEQEIVEWVD